VILSEPKRVSEREHYENIHVSMSTLSTEHNVFYYIYIVYNLKMIN